jgi:intracellular sulfur oxidation DsrE/DsrF family protein
MVRTRGGRCESGGQICACGASPGRSGITDAQLIPGVRIVTAAMVVEQLAQGASTLAFSRLAF